MVNIFKAPAALTVVSVSVLAGIVVVLPCVVTFGLVWLSCVIFVPVFVAGHPARRRRPNVPVFS